MTGPDLPEFQRLPDPVRWWAAQLPDAPALIDGGAVWSYGALAGAATAAGGELAAHGVRAGDRVALVGENSAALVGLILGAASLGAWVIPLNPRLSDREIDEICAHAGARRAVFVTASSPRARDHAERRQAIPFAIEPLGTVAIGPCNEQAAPEPAEYGSVAALIYTSGTTGAPKGVMLTHENLLFSAHSSGLVRRIGPADRVYCVLPLTHILGFTGIVFATFIYGGAVVLAPRFDPVAALRAMTETGITVMLGAPSMFALIVEYLKRKGLDKVPPNALRLIASAGAPLDPAVKRAVEACFGLTLNNGYGITECAPTVSQTRIDAPRADCSVGMLLPGIEARLLGADGAPAAAGDAGALQVRGPNVMLGYYRDAPASRAVLQPDGWFDTGDLARIEDAHLFIVGRTKEQIIRFGFKIYPAEVEAVLNAHPGVRQSAVIGRGAGSDQEVIAFVETASGATVDPAALAAYAAARLAVYKNPSEIRFVTALPMSPTGKVLKAALSAELPHHVRQDA